MIGDKLGKYLDEYMNKFNECFPFMTLPLLDEEEYIELIKKCIAEDKVANYYHKIDRNKIY